MLEGTQQLSYKHSVKDGLEPTKVDRQTTSWQEFIYLVTPKQRKLLQTESANKFLC